MSDTDISPLEAPTRPEIEVLDPRTDEALDREAASASAGGTGAIPGVRVNFGRTPAEFGHAPGLDGLRGLAVIAVLLYHARFEFAIGGFIGVSVFFTLSGYLITSLLLRERARDGAISLKGFWSRRFRRLLPAALAAQAFVLVLAAFGVWDGDQLRALQHDVPAALAQVVNLSFIVRGTSYVGLTTAPSPLNHYWSLSLEEQFYVLFPLVVSAALLVGRSRRRVLVVTLVVGGAVSSYLCWRFAAGNVDRAYFGLDTRLSELLVGALLACATLYKVQLTSRWARAVVALAGIGGLATLVWLTTMATVSARWLYPGGLLVTAAASAAVILASVQTRGVSRFTGLAPFVWVGRISYGLYLFHWPVFLWINPRRTGLDAVPLFGVQMAVTLALALASFHLLEEPIRRRRRLTGRSPFLLAPLVYGGLVVGLIVVTLSIPPRDVSLDGFDPSVAQPAAAAAAAVPPPPPPPPQRVLVVGDELAASLATATLPAGLDARFEATPGCGVSVGGTRIVSGQATDVVNPGGCAQVPAAWTQVDTEFGADVVLVASGTWDITDRQFWSEDPVRRPGEQVFDDFLATEINTRTDELSANGANVVWLTLPHLRRTLPGVPFPPETLPENDPARVDRYNDVLRSVAATNPAITLIDLAATVAAWPGGEFDPVRRPDGVTLSAEAATDVMAWIATQIDGLRRTVDTSAAQEAAAMTDPSTDASLPVPPPPSPRLVPSPGEPARVMIAGDSVAFGYAFGLGNWAQGRNDITIENKGQFNCAVARGGSYRFQQEVAEFPDRCDWAPQFAQWISESRPNVVMLSTGVWDIVDRILPGDRAWRHLGDAEVDTYFLRELLTSIDLLSSQGARVVLVRQHHIDVGINKGFTGLPESDPARVDRLNALLDSAQKLRPDVTAVVDLAGWVASQPGGELDPAKLKDGLHYFDEYLQVIGQWLGPELLNQVPR